MFLYTYEISIYDRGSNTNCGHTGVLFAHCYSDAVASIEDVYTGPDEFLTHIELREFDNGLAPCFEMPAATVKDLINNEGDFAAVVDV
jgi:hypothetical protein